MIAHTGMPDEGMSPSLSHHSPLKQQRLLRGWSQQDVVDSLYALCVADGRPSVGVNVNQIRRWENGHSKPSPIYRKHLCTLFALNAEQLGFLGDLEAQP